MSNLVNKIQAVMNRKINSLHELMLLQMIGEDRSSNVSRTLEEVQSLLSSLESNSGRAEEAANRLDAMVAASKESTAKIAASGRARVFHAQGESYQCAARLWLTITAALGLSLIGLAFAFAFGKIIPPPPSNSVGSAYASYIFGKLLILATVGAAVTFAAKQYSANRHNAVQNFHRSSALRTYRAMLLASSDEGVQNAILQQAAQAIFSPSETGYSKFGSATDSLPMVQLFQGLSREGNQPTLPH